MVAGDFQPGANQFEVQLAAGPFAVRQATGYARIRCLFLPMNWEHKQHARANLANQNVQCFLLVVGRCGLACGPKPGHELEGFGRSKLPGRATESYS